MWVLLGAVVPFVGLRLPIPVCGSYRDNRTPVCGSFCFWTSNTRPYHRVKRWYMRRWLTSVILRAKETPGVFRKSHGALFQMGCFEFVPGSYPLEILSVEKSRTIRSKCRHLRMLTIPSIFGVRQIPGVFQKGHSCIYNAGYLHLS